VPEPVLCSWSCNQLILCNFETVTAGLKVKRHLPKSKI
jgi:hypothetical protein